MKKIVDLFIILTILVDLSHTYRQMQLEDDDLCSLITKRKIKLGKGEKSGLIVSQTRLNDHVFDWHTNFRCKFQLDTVHSKEGIFAVIQELAFRKNQTTDECIDYVQFIRKDGSSSSKICGRFNAATKMNHDFIDPSHPSTPNSFTDIKGELDVIIFVSKEPLKNDEETDIRIVFTTYKYCSDAGRNDDMKPCSNLYRDVCIYKQFLMDNYVNCPYPDCVDEGGCTEPEFPKVKSSLGNKVLIGSISSLFIMFAIFVICLWVCRNYKIFCWANNFASPSTQLESPSPPTHPPTARVLEMNEQSRSIRPHTSNLPTAPVDEDKDLPPSYDSLFPSR